MSDDCLFPNITLNTENPASNTPTGCPTGETPGGGVGTVDNNAENANKDCEVIVDNELYNIHLQNFEAFNTFTTEVDANLIDKTYKELFAPVAAIPNSIRNQSSSICRQYIDVARTMVDLEEFLDGLRLTEKPDYFELTKTLWLEEAVGDIAEKAQKALLVFPNPAKSSFQVYPQQDKLENDDFEISIFNNLGQRVAQQKAKGRNEFLTSDWNRGVYWIEILNLNTSDVQKGRVIIQ